MPVERSLHPAYSPTALNPIISPTASLPPPLLSQTTTPTRTRTKTTTPPSSTLPPNNSSRLKRPQLNSRSLCSRITRHSRGRRSCRCINASSSRVRRNNNNNKDKEVLLLLLRHDKKARKRDWRSWNASRGIRRLCLIRSWGQCRG